MAYVHKTNFLHCSGTTLDVFIHQDAVYGLSVDPLNDNVFASACDDGRILIYDIRAPASEGMLRNFSASFNVPISRRAFSRIC